MANFHFFSTAEFAKDFWTELSVDCRWNLKKQHPPKKNQFKCQTVWTLLTSLLQVRQPASIKQSAWRLCCTLGGRVGECVGGGCSNQQNYRKLRGRYFVRQEEESRIKRKCTMYSHTKKYVFNSACITGCYCWNDFIDIFCAYFHWFQSKNNFTSKYWPSE